MAEDTALSAVEDVTQGIGAESAPQPPVQLTGDQPPMVQQTRASAIDALGQDLSGVGRASHLQQIAPLINQAIPEVIPNAPSPETPELAPQNLAEPGTTVAEIPVVEIPVADAQTQAAEAAPVAEGGETPPAPEPIPEEVTINVDQWNALMDQREADAGAGVASPAQATALPESGEQAPVQPAVEAPQPQAPLRAPMTQEQLSEIVTVPEKLEEYVEGRILSALATNSQQVNEQVMNDMAVYMDNFATMNEVYTQHPELKKFPHQMGRALMAARAANPNAQMHELVQQISKDMDFIVQVEQKVRANKETVDVRPKGAGQFVNNGPARAGAAIVTPPAADANPNSTQNVFGEIMEASQNGRRGLRAQLQR